MVSAVKQKSSASAASAAPTKRVKKATTKVANTKAAGNPPVKINKPTSSKDLNNATVGTAVVKTEPEDTTLSKKRNLMLLSATAYQAKSSASRTVKGVEPPSEKMSAGDCGDGKVSGNGVGVPPSAEKKPVAPLGVGSVSTDGVEAASNVAKFLVSPDVDASSDGSKGASASEANLAAFSFAMRKQTEEENRLNSMRAKSKVATQIDFGSEAGKVGAGAGNGRAASKSFGRGSVKDKVSAGGGGAGGDSSDDDASLGDKRTGNRYGYNFSKPTNGRNGGGGDGDDDGGSGGNGHDAADSSDSDSEVEELPPASLKPWDLFSIEGRPAYSPILKNKNFITVNQLERRSKFESAFDDVPLLTPLYYLRAPPAEKRTYTFTDARKNGKKGSDASYERMCICMDVFGWSGRNIVMLPIGYGQNMHLFDDYIEEKGEIAYSEC